MPSYTKKINISTEGTGEGGDGVPVGAIIAYSANGELPSGYLLCDGSAVSRTMFPDLFSTIGTTYGAGDGSTTFNVPDYNVAKRFVQGDTVAGTVKNAGLPNITGATRGVYNTTDTSTGALRVNLSGSRGAQTASSDSYQATLLLDASLSNPIYGNSTTVQPDALAARYIIKAFEGQTPDSALIDITQYAQDLANKATRDLNNLSSTGLAKFANPDLSNLSSTGESKISEASLTRDFTIIYPNGGSASSPADITKNTRYVMNNPYPGYYVDCKVECKSNGYWVPMPTIDTYSTTPASAGITAGLYNGNIVIQTGINHLCFSNGTKQGMPVAVSNQDTLPCRVWVWKVGKM